MRATAAALCMGELTAAAMERQAATRYGRDVARLLRIVVERRVHGWGQLSVHHAREDVSFPLESGRPETLEDGGCELRGERLSDSEARK